RSPHRRRSARCRAGRPCSRDAPAAPAARRPGFPPARRRRRSEARPASSSLQRRPHQSGDTLSVGPAIDSGHRLLHRLPHVLDRLRPAVADGLLDDALQLGVGQLGRQVATDQLALRLLAGGEVLTSCLTVGPRRLQAPLPLAPEHGELVIGPLLDGLLQLGQHQAQRAHALSLAGTHRPLQIGLDLIDDRHPHSRIRAYGENRAERGGWRRSSWRTRPAQSTASGPSALVASARTDGRWPCGDDRARANKVAPVNESLYADALAPFLAEVEAMRPPGAEVIDAHTHLGLDEDGRSLTLPQLLAQLDAAEARRACVFPLHDPERHPSYRLPNDRVLAWAAESEDRLVPFCRLDPAEDPVDEAERCLSAGARGIKLHPRAQAFQFDGGEMDGVFALAEEASVPILIHAGRGLPPLAEGLAELALRHSGAALILAHGAICDQGILTTRLADHPSVLYDISCFFPLDVIELFARVPAERIVFASDPPYGMPATTLYLALRVARQAGLDEQTTRAMLGGT